MQLVGVDVMRVPVHVLDRDLYYAWSVYLIIILVPNSNYSKHQAWLLISAHRHSSLYATTVMRVLTSIRTHASRESNYKIKIITYDKQKLNYNESCYNKLLLKYNMVEKRTVPT